jgi:anti-anti-sigma factor
VEAFFDESRELNGFMNICHSGDTLSVSGLAQLASATSESFKSTLCGPLPANVKHINIDLSETGYVDCAGLGALVALKNCASRRDGSVAIRLLNPTPPVRRIFKLTRMDRVFPFHRD